MFSATVALRRLRCGIRSEASTTNEEKSVRSSFVFDQQHCVGGLRGTRNRACWPRPATEVAAVEVGRMSDDTAKNEIV